MPENFLLKKKIYFKLYLPFNLSQLHQSAAVVTNTATDHTQTKGHGCVPIKFSLGKVSGSDTLLTPALKQS